MGLVGSERAFLDSLGESERGELIALGRPQVFGAGSFLISEGDRTNGVMVLLSGWVTVSVSIDRGGTRLILALRGPGELIGELAALDGRPRSATVRALGQVKAAAISGDSFRRFLATNPRIGALVMRQLTARLRSADSERSALASMTVVRRVAGRLVELTEIRGAGPYVSRRAPHDAQDPGSPVVVHLPQDELAATVGATREAVTKALKLLRDQRVVRTERGRVEIMQPALLELLAAGTDSG